MSNDNIIIGRLEQEFLDRLNTALTALQTAQTTFVDTIDKLELHNTEEDSHLDIRQMLIELKVGAGFLTPSAGEALVATGISDHEANNSCHPDIRTLLSEINDIVSDLDARLKVLEPDEGDDTLTELEYRLKLIDEYYDPILEALLQAWQVAAMQGLPTADNIADEYQNVLQLKAQARADVLREFQYM